MNIRPSAAIRQNYNEIAEQCRKTAEFEKAADSLSLFQICGIIQQL